jgi:4-hydroxybenzoate polyprenyltransferase
MSERVGVMGKAIAMIVLFVLMAVGLIDSLGILGYIIVGILAAYAISQGYKIYKRRPKRKSKPRFRVINGNGKKHEP